MLPTTLIQEPETSVEEFFEEHEKSVATSKPEFTSYSGLSYENKTNVHIP